MAPSTDLGRAHALFLLLVIAKLRRGDMLTNITVADAVAPTMVLVENIPNGYHDLILPMATEDDVLRRAVGVVAAQHLSRRRPEMRVIAKTGRAAIISRLRHQSRCNSADQVFNRYTWATLVVLLLGELVKGNVDYRFLIGILRNVSANINVQDRPSEIARFLLAQTNMSVKFPQFPNLAFPTYTFSDYCACLVSNSPATRFATNRAR